MPATRPDLFAERLSALPIAGDDPAAKATAAAFLDALGYDTVDAGPLAEGWRFQRDTPAYATPYFGPDPSTGQAGVPTGAAAVRAALAAARRYADTRTH